MLKSNLWFVQRGGTFCCINILCILFPFITFFFHCVICMVCSIVEAQSHTHTAQSHLVFVQSTYLHLKAMFKICLNFFLFTFKIQLNVTTYYVFWTSIRCQKWPNLNQNMTYFERSNFVEITSSVGCSNFVKIGSYFERSKFVEIRSNSDVQNRFKSDQILDVLCFLK